jgi:uncharacterized heparinase superfamily protein
MSAGGRAGGAAGELPADDRPGVDRPEVDRPGGERPGGERLRFTRERGHLGPSLAERLAEQLDRLHFRSPLHRLRLKGRFPLKLLAVPQDPVPGDSKAGARIRAGRLFHAGYGQAIAEVRFDDPRAPAAWRAYAHGWGWLRDAAAGAPPTRAEIARVEALARRWLAAHADYDPVAWAPELTGRRLMLAVAHAPLILSAQDHVHRSVVLNAVARWTRHLERAGVRMAPGLPQVEALAGLVAGHLILPGNEARIERALASLDAALGRLLGPRAAIPSRCPRDLADIGDLLLFVAAFHRARGQGVSAVVARHLDLVRDGLAALAEGDGVPAAWHGGQPSPAQVARLEGARAQGALPAAASGYRRLAAGETSILIDAGPPPPARANALAHASTLAFTMSDGARPLLVSCGAERGDGPGGAAGRQLDPALAEGLRTTAAHCALVLADTNSTRIARDGPRRQGGVSEVVVETRASAEGQWLEASHDGWRRRFGLDHVRRLWLSPDGADLRGEDRLVAAPRGALRLASTAFLPVSVRFHLAPGCEAVPTEDGHGALIRTADGRSWSFRARFSSRPGRLLVEASVHLDAEGERHAIQQIHLETETGPERETRVGWSFRRAAAARPAPARRRG